MVVYAPSRALYYGVFAPLVATSIGIVFREYTRRMYFAEMKMKEAFWTDVVTVVLQIAGVEFLYVTDRLNVANTLFMLSFGAIVVSLWWLAREWRKLSFGLQEMLDDARRNTRLGRWFLGANMVFMVSSQCNPWMLSWLLGGSSVGDYAVCESVANIPRVALTSMQNMMAPTMAHAYAERRQTRAAQNRHTTMTACSLPAVQLFAVSASRSSARGSRNRDLSKECSRQFAHPILICCWR